MRSRIAASAVVAFSLVSGPAVLAQNPNAPPDIGFSAIPFNFSPPGARSLAMGGTFIGVADDATASASNPAGLIILSKPEFSAHGRFTKAGDLERSVGEAGYASSFGSSVKSPSFFSVVIPRGNVAFSVYYQQVANFDTANSTGGVLRLADLPGVDINVGAFSGVELKLEDLGFSAAVRMDKVSIGATIIGRRMTLGYYSDITADVPRFNLSFIDWAAVDGNDKQVAFNAGILVNPNGKFSLGAVYKRGGDFEFPYAVYVDDFGVMADCPPGFAGTQAVCGPASVTVPDTFGVGFGYRPGETWLVAADATLVQYSKLGETILRRIPLDIFPPVTNQAPPPDFDDVVELHGGIERTFTGTTPVSVRAGVMHRPNFNPEGSIDAGATFITFGAGAVMGKHVQIDAAASLSDQVKEALVSFVYRF